MLSLLKKNPEASGGSGARPWRPNFRNALSLPDTKAVRTNFVVKAAAALVTLGLLLMVVTQEYTLWDLRGQIADRDAEIAGNQKPSQDAVALFTRFQAEEAKIRELEAFMGASKIVVSKFIERLGKSIPSKVAITAVDYSSAGVNLRGVAIGAPEQAIGMASNYEKLLREDTEISSRFNQITLINLAPQNGRLTFEISMRSNPEKKEAKKP